MWAFSFTRTLFCGIVQFISHKNLTPQPVYFFKMKYFPLWSIHTISCSSLSHVFPVLIAVTQISFMPIFFFFLKNVAQSFLQCKHISIFRQKWCTFPAVKVPFMSELFLCQALMRDIKLPMTWLSAHAKDGQTTPFRFLLSPPYYGIVGCHGSYRHHTRITCNNIIPKKRVRQVPKFTKCWKIQLVSKQILFLLSSGQSYFYFSPLTLFQTQYTLRMFYLRTHL